MSINRSVERGDTLSHELQNREHTEEWPEADRPLNGDDSDAPVSLDDTTPEQTLDSSSRPDEPLSADTADVADRFEAPDETGTAAAAGTAMDDPDPADAAGVRNGDNVDITNGGARDIDADTVSITQGGARDIDATTVTISQGGAARIRADELSVSQGGVGFARTEHLTLQEGGTAFAVVADTATLDPETSVFLLIAGSTKGDVRPVMDWRAAAAFGAGFAFILSLLRRVRR